jgi:hypothetical protein
MNLRVLPYVAALMVPAAVTGAGSALVARKLLQPKPSLPTWSNRWR